MNFQFRRNAVRSRTQKGMTRRLLFQRAAAATGVLAVSCTDTDKSATDAQAMTSGQLREYWIQADSFYHNLMPSGIDAMSGTHYAPNESSYWAIGYRAYTPGWKKPLTGDDNIGANTGIPGPVLRAAVGDTV